MRKELSIEIDILSESVIAVQTGKIYETNASKVEAKFINSIHKKDGWKFNWKKEYKNQSHLIYKLTLKIDSNIILGLISIEIKEDHVQVHLIESSPLNVGKSKVYLGIGANLFAFACKVSEDKGFDGNIGFISKTSLVEHYSLNLGAIHLGSGKMIIRENIAKKLIQKYFSHGSH